MTAPEDDRSGTGKKIGWWYMAKLDYDITEKHPCKHDKLISRLLLEVLEPDNYYRADDTAFFLQWQIIYKF